MSEAFITQVTNDDLEGIMSIAELGIHMVVCWVILSSSCLGLLSGV